MGKHEASILPETDGPLQAAVPGPTRLKERRQHKRHDSLQLRLTLLGADHDATNWSLGGFLIKDAHPHTPVGTTTAGFLSIPGIAGRFAIRVELVRRDKRAREIAFRFVDPSRSLLDALSRL